MQSPNIQTRKKTWKFVTVTLVYVHRKLEVLQTILYFRDFCFSKFTKIILLSLFQICISCLFDSSGVGFFLLTALVDTAKFEPIKNFHVHLFLNGPNIIVKTKKNLHTSNHAIIVKITWDAHTVWTLLEAPIYIFFTPFFSAVYNQECFSFFP